MLWYFINKIINIMYNAFVAKKKSLQQQQQRHKTEAKQNYVKRYYKVTRPSLIDNYNKRINSFIRKLEQQPIKISLKPDLKQQSQRSEEGDILSKSKFLADQTFKFKDNEDWKSMYTPWQRIQRKKNYQIFKKKYGDPDLAFRSIGSQSQYNPSLANEFRIRQKSLQINPPMKYTNKPTKQVLANLNKNRTKRKSRQSLQKQLGTSKRTENISRDQEVIFRRNTGSSLSGLNDDLTQNDNISIGRDNQSYAVMEQSENQQKTKQKKKQLKIHFKQIMDLQQNIQDQKSKKALRQLLYKCGVYRRKNRRAVTDSDIDKFSELEAVTLNR